MDTASTTGNLLPAQRRRRAATALAAFGLTLGAAFTAGCSKTDDGRTPGQTLDAAIEKVERKAEEIKASAPGAVRDLKDAARDAAVTAAVKAELARDTSLSALKIDVDTHAGRVALRGSAPDEASRERATRLALGVKGVSGVDNELVVAPAR